MEGQRYHSAKGHADGDAAEGEGWVLRVLRVLAPLVGLSTLWPCFRTHLLTFLTRSGVHTTAAIQSAYTAHATAFVLCTLIVLLATSRVVLLLHKPSVSWALGCTGLVGALVLWAPISEPLDELMCAVGSACVTVFFTGMFLLYMSRLRAYGIRAAAMLFFLSFGFGFFDNVVLLGPDWLAPIFCVLTPVLCAVCAPRESFSSDEEKDRAAEEALPISQTVLVALAVLFALFCVAGNLVRGLTNPWFAYTGPTMRTAVMTSINVAIVVLSALVLHRGFDINRTLFWNWVAYTILFFGGLMLLILGGTTAAGLMGSDLATSSRVGFTLVTALFVLEASARRSMDDLIRMAALLLFLPEAISAVVRYVAVPYLLHTVDVEVTTLATWSGMAVTFLLIVAITVVLGNLLLRQAAISMFAPGPTPSATAIDSTREALDALASHYGLTVREAQATGYVARGYSLDKTAEIMGISINTVRTYMRASYAKLEVHSRQELIDLLDVTRRDVMGMRSEDATS
jgi:DNA-binding CsgD family transcriptional regulator